MFNWAPQNEGYTVLIDPPTFPTDTIVAIDLETNGKEYNDPGFKIVCIGVCGDSLVAHIYFNITDSLITYLRSVQIVAHNGAHAEFVWLQHYGIGIEQLYADTKILSYVFDSSRKSHGLKDLLKEKFGKQYPTYTELIKDPEAIALSGVLGPKGKPPKKLTLDQMPKEVVAAYNANDIIYTYKLWEWFRVHFNYQQWTFFNNIEMPTTRLLFKMEQKGVAIDTKAVRRIHNEHSKARRKARKEVLEVAAVPDLNLNSPKQLLPIVRSDCPDADGTGEEVLSQYPHSPFCQGLLTYRKHNKICTTYTIPLYTYAMADKENRIHALFNQNTITGRLSSSDPINLQNQPQAVRECFVSSPGHKLIGADWSNIELRLPAHFSGEEGFCRELLQDNGDLHAATGRFLFPNYDLLPEEERKEKRGKAKTCNFLLTNSGTAHRLSQELGCSLDEATSFYTKFWQGYPTLKAWLEKEKAEARRKGWIQTWFGRRVTIPTLALTCEWGAWRCGKHKDERGFVRTCKNCRIREEAERTAISIRVQGTASDMAKMAGLRLEREYGYVPVLAVHDELVYEVFEDSADIAAKRIKHVMENITTLKVPLVTNVKIGHSWKEIH